MSEEPTPEGSGLTLGELVIRMRRRALSDLHEETDTLGANMTNSQTTMELGTGQNPGSLATSGQLAEIDQELVQTQGPSTSGMSIGPLLRGALGTTAASHTAGATITVNPRFPWQDVVDAMNEDIDDLSSPANGLFQVLEVTVTANPVLVGYDLTDSQTNTPVNPNDLLFIIGIRAQEYGPFQIWKPQAPRLFQLQRNADTTIFPSGIALEYKGDIYPGRELRVLYAAPYTTPLVNPTDNVFSVTGLQTTAQDIPIYGAALTLMGFREMKRTYTEAQPEPRRSQEVPVGSSLTAAKFLMQKRQDRIAAERSRLDRMYPRNWLA